MIITVDIKMSASVARCGNVLNSSYLIFVGVACYADQERNDVDLDREFLQGLRELKFLSEKELVDEHKVYVMASLSASLCLFTRVICTVCVVLSVNIPHMLTR